MRGWAWPLLGLALIPVVQAGSAPLRIASINMCTDQMLLDLAAPETIAALSPYAADAARSWAAEKAVAFPRLSAGAEEILLLKPDLVVASRFTRRATREMLAGKGVKIEEFSPVDTIAEARRQISRFGVLTGNEAKAAQRLSEIDAALERLRAAGTRQSLRILPLARRGWASGRKSLTSDLLAAAGLSNAIGDLRFEAGGFVSLETVIKLRPDAILLSRDDDQAEDQGRAMLLHPAIAGLFPPERRLVISEKLTICGGPMLPEAMDALAQQIEKLRPRDAVQR